MKFDFLSASTDDAFSFAGGSATPPRGAGIPGVVAGTRMFENLPASEYHADTEILSCSRLKPMFISPGHFAESLRTPHKGSDAMTFGSLVHTLVLEPRLLGREFAVFPGISDGRNAEYKAFAAAGAGRIVIDEPTLSAGRRVAEKIIHRKVMGRPFGDFIAEGVSEASIYFTDPTTGVPLRIRPDLKHPEFTFDLKTTRHETVRGFTRDCVQMHYDFQAYMYSLGRCLFEGTEKPKPFVFVAAESTGPHSVHVVSCSERFLSNGLAKYMDVVGTYKACSDAGYFPDASGDEVADIEHWEQYSPNSSWRSLLAKA